MYKIKIIRHTGVTYPNIKTIIKETYKNVEAFHFYNTNVQIKFFDKDTNLHLYNIISVKIYEVKNYKLDFGNNGHLSFDEDTVTKKG